MAFLQVLAPSSAANVKIGVPENYDGIFPWYLAKVRRVGRRGEGRRRKHRKEGIRSRGGGEEKRR